MKPDRPCAVDLAEGARRAAGLLAGRPDSIEAVCREIGVGPRTLGERLRIAELRDDVRAAARRLRAPMRLLVEVAAYTQEACMIDRLEAWARERDALRLSSRKRRTPARRRSGEPRSDAVIRATYAYVIEADKDIEAALREDGGERGDAPAFEADIARARLRGMLSLARFLAGKTAHVAGAPGLARRIREAAR